MRARALVSMNVFAGDDMRLRMASKRLSLMCGRRDRSAGGGDESHRDAARKPLHGTGRDDGSIFGVSFVVLLDILEVVEIIHHHPMGLRDPLLRPVTEPMQLFESC